MNYLCQGGGYCYWGGTVHWSRTQTLRDICLLKKDPTFFPVLNGCKLKEAYIKTLMTDASANLISYFCIKIFALNLIYCTNQQRRCPGFQMHHCKPTFHHAEKSACLRKIGKKTKYLLNVVS